MLPAPLLYRIRGRNRVRDSIPFDIPGLRIRNQDIYEAAYEVNRAFEMHQLVRTRASRQHGIIVLADSFYQHLHRRAKQPVVALAAVLIDGGIQSLKTLALDLHRYIILHHRRWRSFTRRINERVSGVVADLPNQGQRLLKLLIGLTGNPTMMSVVNATLGIAFLILWASSKYVSRVYLRLIFEHLRTSRLYRQVNMLDQVTTLRQHLNQVIIEIPWMGCSEANTRDIDLVNIIHQIAETVFDIFKVFAICVHVLTEQRNFLIPLPG